MGLGSRKMGSKTRAGFRRGCPRWDRNGCFPLGGSYVLVGSGGRNKTHGDGVLDIPVVGICGVSTFLSISDPREPAPGPEARRQWARRAPGGPWRCAAKAPRRIASERRPPIAEAPADQGATRECRADSNGVPRSPADASPLEGGGDARHGLSGHVAPCVSCPRPGAAAGRKRGVGRVAPVACTGGPSSTNRCRSRWGSPRCAGRMRRRGRRRRIDAGRGRGARVAPVACAGARGPGPDVTGRSHIAVPAVTISCPAGRRESAL